MKRTLLESLDPDDILHMGKSNTDPLLRTQHDQRALRMLLQSAFSEYAGKDGEHAIHMMLKHLIVLGATAEHN